jgi:PPK2 family polyphosphate:nucleotide phosphotransferase
MDKNGKLKKKFTPQKIKPGSLVSLRDHDPAFLPSLPKVNLREEAEASLSHSVEQLKALQELLYASDSWSILLIFQGMDTAGKDSIIRRVMSGLNPQGCSVTSFKHPSLAELDHNFLWRYSKEMPARGRVGVFNRSYYEEVLIVRVHDRIYQAQRIPDPVAKDTVWAERFEDINAFEKHLSRNGTKVLKFFLNLSKEEQRKRLLKRIENPEKHWKFDFSDISEREYWDDYTRVYEKMLSATSTTWAPWYVIPADHKWLSSAMVAEVLLRTISGLKLKHPVTTPEKEAQLKTARERLERDTDS